MAPLLATERSRAYLALIAGVTCFSFSSILIRYSDAPAPVIAAYRMLLAAVIIAPFALRSSWKETKGLGRFDVLFLVATGVVLSVHFLLFVTSVQMTSVASATVLINAHPIIVAIMAFALLSEGNRYTAAGAVVGLMGVVVISASEMGTTNFVGDLFAFSGAVMESVYIIMTRMMRKRIGIGSFVLLVNFACAFSLIGMCFFGGVPLWPYSTQNLLLFLAMAIVPAAIGYTLYNYSLRWLSAPQVSVTQLGEALLASIMAVFLFAEYPSPLIIVGGVLVVVGIYLATRVRNGARENGKARKNATEKGAV
jgi:drug/metabolite transporter (DMT)-like permease